MNRVGVLDALASGLAGVCVIYGGIRLAFLSWVVNIPGKFVGMFLSVNFHEGEGAAGFFLALFLGWLCASLAFWMALKMARHLGKRSENGARKCCVCRAGRT